MTRSHVIVLPGGGYTGHAPHEAEPFADWFVSLGLESSVFRYPVATRHPGPLLAIQAEVARVRRTGVDRIALIGFSAGGHAAGHAALTSEGDEGVDLAMLCYPVVSMELDSHQGSREQLIGLDASAALRTTTSLDRLVTADAPPFFIWHTAADQSVPPQHSYLLASALADHGVSHELHVFATGVHGLGFAAGEPGASAWPRLAETWLRTQSWID